MAVRMRRKLAIVAAVASIGLVASACSSGGDGGAGGNAGGNAGGSSTVKLGLLVDLTGELGSFGKPWQQAFQLAADDINAVGGLPGGATIQTVVEDEKTNPEIAVKAAQKMIDVEGVSAILGPTSGPMVSLVPLAKRSQVPIISNAAGTISLNTLGGDYIYRTVASDNSDGLASAKFVLDQGGTKAAVVYQNEESPASVGKTFQQSFESGGGTVAANVAINPGSPSYQAEAGEVVSASPDWVFCACGQQSGVTFLKNLISAGYSGKILVAADLVVPEVVDAVGASQMEGIFGEAASSDTSIAAYKAFASEWTAKYGEDPGLFTANAYDAMVLVALAMVKAGATDGAAINSAIRDVAGPGGEVVTSYADGLAALQAGNDINYEGASGPVDFDSSGTVTSAYLISQVQNGKWETFQFYPASEFVTSG